MACPATSTLSWSGPAVHLWQHAASESSYPAGWMQEASESMFQQYVGGKWAPPNLLCSSCGRSFQNHACVHALSPFRWDIQTLGLLVPFSTGAVKLGLCFPLDPNQVENRTFAVFMLCAQSRLRSSSRGSWEIFSGFVCICKVGPLSYGKCQLQLFQASCSLRN